MEGVEEMIQILVVKEHQNNDELQEARKELIKDDMQNSSLHKASIEQKKADESVLRLVEEQKVSLLKSLTKMFEEKDYLHQAFFEETKKLQQLAREHVKRVLDEQEMVNADLEKRRKKLDLWIKELNKREALTEREKQKLDEEKQKNDMQNSSLHKASIEQKKADESVLWLVEEQKREKEGALKKVLELERQLDAKQKLEMEIEELKGKLQVKKHLGDSDDTAVQEQIKKMNDALEAKMKEMDGVEEINQTLVVKVHQRNDDMQEARKELIKEVKCGFFGWVDPPMSARSSEMILGLLRSKNRLEIDVKKLKGQLKRKNDVIKMMFVLLVCCLCVYLFN